MKPFLQLSRSTSIVLIRKFCQSSVSIPSISDIPKASIKKSFSCSGGSPGGQHVNKVATRAEIRFSIDEEWIPGPVRQVMEKKYGYRLNKDREMIITSSKTRSQVQNLDDCFEKLEEVLKACAYDVALEERKVPNDDDAEILDESHCILRRKKAAYHRRIGKERHSTKKRLRSEVYD